MDRPIDALNQAKGKRVLLRLKNGVRLTGTLRALDLHLNIWLDDAEEITENERVKLGTVLVRGDTILYATPQ